jgi:chaperonin GroEL (HSP60 family)
MSFKKEVSHIRVFSKDILKTSREQLLNNNIISISVLTEILKTSLGPSGMNKIIVETSGNWVVTKDGRSIIGNIDIRHPIVKLITNIVDIQKNEVGDGTKSSIILARELLVKAKALVDLGVHPVEIISGYKKALEICLKYMERISKHANLDDLSILKKICWTFLVCKNLDIATDILTDVSVTAILKLVQNINGCITDISKEDVSIVKKRGSSLFESNVIDGIIVDRSIAHNQMPRRIKSAKIVLISIPIKLEKEWFKGELILRSMEDVKSMFNEEIETLKNEVVYKLMKCGTNVIFCENTIDDRLLPILARHNMMAVTRVRTSDLWRLAKATGGKVIASLRDLSETDLGQAGVVREVNIGEDKLIVVEKCPKAKAISILLRSSLERQLIEAEEAVSNLITLLITFLNKRNYVAGGGATEMFLSRLLREEAKKFSGKEQLSILSFADALEVIPKTLSENAGLESIDILAKLRSEHQCGKYSHGIDVISKEITDMFEVGVIEPVSLKELILKHAFEIASMILRIDEMFYGLEFMEEEFKIDKDVPPTSDEKRKKEK